MRMATVSEIIASFGAPALQSLCEVSGASVSRWRRTGSVPENQLIKIAMRYPHRIVVDDDNTPWWLDEVSFEPPEWVPSTWWSAYIHMRQKEHMPCEEKDLQDVVRALDLLRKQGYDPAVVLRHATVQRLLVPVAASQREEK